LEGDLVAEGLELADAVTHLGLEVDPGVVLLGSEVVKPDVVGGDTPAVSVGLG
jgi:hypothetical protein